MQIFISKDFSSKLIERTEKEMKVFNEKINELKSMNKTTILNRDDVVVLTSNENITVYAYNIQSSVYVLFAFKEKNEIVLLDELKFISKNKIESLVYGDTNNVGEQTNNS